MEWLYAVVGVVAGLLIGALLGRAGSSAKQLGDELKQTKQELDAYRDKVTQHFSRTAELVEILAANSRDIYRHLASGSEELCNSDAVRLSDTVLKTLPESAVEAAPLARESELAEPAVDAGAAEAEPQAEAAPAADEGEEKQEGATVQPDEAGLTEPSEAPTEKPVDAKQAEQTASDSQWTEILPEHEEPKEPARLH